MKQDLVEASVAGRKRSEEEYAILLTVFHRLMDRIENGADSIEIIEELIVYRSGFLIDRVLDALRLDLDSALDIIRNKNDFTSRYEKEQRNILLAGIDNLIDFAVAEEYIMLSEMQEKAEREEYESVFEKHNLRYASQENEDVYHAGLMAYWWLSVAEDSWVTFMTQGDDRVRAWHLSYEGMSYRKNDFPPSLIPPIEHGCRCFLISDSYGMIQNALPKNALKKINPVFKESLAAGGRIFSEEHSYFKLKLPVEFENIKKRIKQRFNVHG